MSTVNNDIKYRLREGQISAINSMVNSQISIQLELFGENWIQKLWPQVCYTGWRSKSLYCAI